METQLALGLLAIDFGLELVNLLFERIQLVSYAFNGGATLFSCASESTYLFVQLLALFSRFPLDERLLLVNGLAFLGSRLVGVLAFWLFTFGAFSISILCISVIFSGFGFSLSTSCFSLLCSSLALVVFLESSRIGFELSLDSFHILLGASVLASNL